MQTNSSASRLAATVLLATTGLAIAVVFLLFERYPQPPEYFDFADQRTLFGIPNFWNVATNLLFLAPGAAGLWLLGRPNSGRVLRSLYPAYHVLFAGVLLTAFGSAWFHLDPNNSSLFWDRLPMTVAFMSLTAIVAGEHIAESLGRKMLWPLLAAGAGSVIYWAFSEAQGSGDLRAYGLVQFLPLLLIPAVLLGCRSAFDRTGFIWIAFLFYAMAKLAEQLDSYIFALGNTLSGHSVKHVCAALTAAVLLYGGATRRRER